MIAEPILPVANHSSTAPVVVAMPRSSGSMNVLSMVVTAGLNVCSSSSVGGFALSYGRVIDATGAMYPGSAIATDQRGVSDELEFIRSVGGLTRDQLAQLLGVSRRTIHTWANGGSIRNHHYDQVMELAEKARKMRAQPPFKVRQALLKGSAINVGKSVPVSKPVLASDDRPFEHNLDVRPTKLKIIRK